MRADLTLAGKLAVYRDSMDKIALIHVLFDEALGTRSNEPAGHKNCLEGTRCYWLQNHLHSGGDTDTTQSECRFGR